ncbi:MAG: Fumarylacetoacetate hydrolase family protein [Actinomycetota bacterium]|jgi:2-keto-4-pentenoate hydratase/2-oxohepta-3-ene-1,7-dioic acid hydratase in catechol pathway|nr:Fumarylacetoacetate hydrolase family protein [Actinomycetota bacterium]
MRLVTYASDRGPRAGVQTDQGVLDAWDMIGSEEGSGLKELLASGRLDEVKAAVEAGSGYPLLLGPGGILAPIPDPDKIICIGLNYRAHAEETGAEIPKAPTIFGKYRNALVPDGATVALPPASRRVDYEAEVAFVIGRRAASVSVEDALDHVAGYTLLNDLSARDLQGLTMQWMAGKVFDGAAPCGPALVTPDEAGPHDAIGIAMHVNGEERQSSSTADLIFSVPELVATLSTWLTLEPGDIISTGTPSGVGLAMDPRTWLEDEDELVVSSPVLGELRTKIKR